MVKKFNYEKPKLVNIGKFDKLTAGSTGSGEEANSKGFP